MQTITITYMDGTTKEVTIGEIKTVEFKEEITPAEEVVKPVEEAVPETVPAEEIHEEAVTIDEPEETPTVTEPVEEKVEEAVKEDVKEDIAPVSEETPAPVEETPSEPVQEEIGEVIEDVEEPVPVKGESILQHIVDSVTAEESAVQEEAVTSECVLATPFPDGAETSEEEPVEEKKEEQPAPSTDFIGA